ncbi:MAG: hypothetical protein ACRDXE_04890 [Acidimicrobiales bacterium]
MTYKGVLRDRNGWWVSSWKTAAGNFIHEPVPVNKTVDAATAAASAQAKGAPTWVRA